MTVSPLDQSKLKAPQSATNRGTPYTSSPEEMPTRLVASTKADGTKPSAHVVRPARVRHVHKQGMQGGLNDAPIKSPLASGKWDDEDQSEWTTSENQPSGKGTGLKHGAWRTVRTELFNKSFPQNNDLLSFRLRRIWAGVDQRQTTSLNQQSGRQAHRARHSIEDVAGAG